MSGGDEQGEQRLSLSQSKPSGAATDLLSLAMPHLAALDPDRAKAVSRLLVQLETLRRERVALIMPELMIGSR
jgi:hypothetical protein